MSNELRIKCPDIALKKENRIKELFSDISSWIDSEELQRLVCLFGGSLDKTIPLKEKIDCLNEFVEVWDYRKMQVNCGERWFIQNDSFVEEHSDEIINAAEGLGLRNVVEPLITPNYILPLGGGRMSNLIRPMGAKAMSDKFMNEKHSIIALGGMRPLNDIERPYSDRYAPAANTEYDAICAGMEQAFGLEGHQYKEEIHVEENVNLCSAIRKYRGTDIYVVAAPSTNPERRANSMDTFEYFMDRFDVKKGDRILLVTSCIYVPFQFLKFMKIALEKELIIDCVGAPFDNEELIKTSNYLQEIKSAVNAMKALADEYRVFL